MVDPDRVRREFSLHFGRPAERAFYAPGRVNLIGEHTDYNDGFVLPVAIDRDIVIAAARNGSTTCHVFAIDKNEEETFALRGHNTLTKGRWVNYVVGVTRVMEDRGYSLVGLDVAFASDIPIGAGLSSSAAIEIATGICVERMSGLAIDPIEMALMCQQAEHQFVGTMCGIMDQFISRSGKRDGALLIDCRSLSTKSVHVPVRDHQLLICDTGVKHDLASSAYNERRRECELAVTILREAAPSATSLRDIDWPTFLKIAPTMPNDLMKRARHVITENARTLSAASALESGDFALLRELMHASHASLRDDYEVSAPELDLLVEHAKTLEGEQGTRMTGGGFGGCTISVVERHHVRDFVDSMKSEYQSKTGRKLRVIEAEIIDGASELA